jgi:hypothetical protein
MGFGNNNKVGAAWVFARVFGGASGKPDYCHRKGCVIGSTIGQLSAATAAPGFAGLAARWDALTGNKNRGT